MENKEDHVIKGKCCKCGRSWAIPVNKADHTDYLTNYKLNVAECFPYLSRDEQLTITVEICSECLND